MLPMHKHKHQIIKLFFSKLHEIGMYISNVPSMKSVTIF